MPASTQRPLRIAVISDGAAGMCLAESLLAAPVYVDLITARTAPAGLLHSTPVGDQAPRLRLIGNVRVGVDVHIDELHELYDAVVTPDMAPAAALASAEITAAVFPERPQDTPPRLLELLDARGVAVTSWQGWTAGATESTDWAAVELSSRGVPVCM
ncbi:MAG: hypothetical protein Q4G50_08745 [Corynebacterium sp.]|uniref:hypothetical protein n=1 Tax=Corynebacterium sp. TaxID=1720 RepID=UPI0026E053A1|nr:hypothetical protein [Corynebacterium sp.]MDO5670077.1 hypothetical protein [Corynebacterium sp.]